MEFDMKAIVNQVIQGAKPYSEPETEVAQPARPNYQRLKGDSRVMVKKLYPNTVQQENNNGDSYGVDRIEAQEDSGLRLLSMEPVGGVPEQPGEENMIIPNIVSREDLSVVIIPDIQKPVEKIAGIYGNPEDSMAFIEAPYSRLAYLYYGDQILNRNNGLKGDITWHLDEKKPFRLIFTGTAAQVEEACKTFTYSCKKKITKFYWNEPSPLIQKKLETSGTKPVGVQDFPTMGAALRCMNQYLRQDAGNSLQFKLCGTRMVAQGDSVDRFFRGN